jgi:hypothetical protein
MRGALFAKGTVLAKSDLAVGIEGFEAAFLFVIAL